MDEVFTSLKEPLINGIAPSESLPPNAPYANTYVGMRPCASGAESLYPVTFPIDGYVQSEHTYLMQGANKTLLYDFSAAASLCDILSPTVDLLATAVSAKDNVTPTVLTETAKPEFVEKHDRWVIVNEKALITNAALYDTWAIAEATDRPIPSSMCFCQDRLVMVGFTDSTYFDTAFWLKVWEVWKAASPTAEAIDDAETMSDSYVFYGMPRFGGKDLFSLELSLFTGYRKEEFETKILAAVREGLMGFIKIPWEGSALCCREHIRGAVIYGSEGMGLLQFDEKGVPTLQSISEVGLMTRESISGIAQYQGGVAADGNLFVLDDKGLTFLDYRYIFKDTDPVVSFDKARKDLYIYEGNCCYILTPKPALCVGLYDVTSLYTVGGDLYGSYVAEQTVEFEFRSWMLAFKRRSSKTLQLIQLEQDGLTDLTSTIEYRYAENAVFEPSPTKPYNKEGVVSPRTFAPELIVVVNGTPSFKPENSQVTNLTVHWRTTDKRYIHGLSENTGQETL